mgnify:FL=1
MALVISSRFHIVAASAELVDCREALRVVVNLRGNKIADRLCKGRGACTCTLRLGVAVYHYGKPSPPANEPTGLRLLRSP